METDAVIASLFDLPVASKPLCDAASCKSVIDLLFQFCDGEFCQRQSWISKPERDAFCHALKVLKATEPCEKINWLPEYGCAVMKSTHGCPSGEVAINLIGLDLHCHQTTSKLSASTYDYVDTAIATDYDAKPIGICTIEELPNRESSFRSLLSSVQSRTDKDRSARGGKQGHQRTPAFIHALYRQVFSSVQELPRGGFTDVGLHTGGEPRSTSGPLVFSLLHQLLQDYEAQHDGISSDLLFRKILIYFGLFTSHKMIKQYDTSAPAAPKSNAPDILLEHAYHILQSAAIKAAPASDDGLDMSFFVEWSKDLQSRITSRASQASAEYSKQFRLPLTDEEIRGHFDNFSFDGNKQSNITDSVTRRADVYCQLSLKDHYNNHQSSTYHNPRRSRVGSDHDIFLRSVSDCIPKEIGHSNVDYIHNKMDGIWYPDSLRPRMAWFGGTKSFDRSPSGYEINPFATLCHLDIVSNFTERLPKDGHLQWTVIQPGDSYIHLSRGNLPYARQNEKPAWLSKTEYLAFANLRSHPNIQIRNVLVAIKERQLPFNDACVQLLINQSLFHLGDVTVANSCAAFEWKRDLEDSDFCKDVCTILSSFYNELKDSPKNYECVKWLGGLCNFFSEWEPSCRLVARQLGQSVHDWAENIGRDIEKSPPSMAPEIRAKQVVLYQHAIMAIAGSSLNEADAEILIEMLFKTRNLFTGDNRQREIYNNEVQIQYLIAQRVDDILELTLKNPAVITKALVSFYPRCPIYLKWKRWAGSSGIHTQCFQSKGNDGTVYAVNLISGEILINGLPPSRLPLSVLQHQLYKRTFGDRQFEVLQKNEYLETCRPIFGRFYRFSLGSSLRIYEFCEDESELLELIDVTDASYNWSNDLPTRLTNMHSQWIYRQKNTIVLRGIRFNDRKISYLIQIQPPFHHVFESQRVSVKGKVKCVEVYDERHSQLSVLLKEVDTMDTLVLHQSPALDILSKFEPKKFIHSLVSSTSRGNGKIKFYLPRYKMTFVLDQGTLHCQEIAGYKLMVNQQRDDTLRGTKVYLLLESSGVGPNLIVFPEGKVERKSHGVVDVIVKKDCDVELLWYQYEFHPRFKYIETKQSRASRLQLVALHMSTTSLLPDTLLGMTGEERAITLIRQCWGNRPLNQQEGLALSNIKQLARGRSPTLSVLCQDIETSAQQLPFLYANNNGGHCHGNSLCFEGSAYLNNVKSCKLTSRCYLTKREEARVIGIQARRPRLPPRFSPTQVLLPCPVDQSEVESMQEELDEIYSASTHETKKQKTNHCFPLDVNPSSKLEADMLKELKESWDAHHQNSASHHTDYSKIDIQDLHLMNIRCINLRLTTEKYALEALNKRPTNCPHWHDKAHQMKQLVGLVPSATIADLARIAIEPSLIDSFNPMLNLESRDMLLASIITWLRLCVYEDKFERILVACNSGATEEAMKEMQTKSVWDGSEHPYWLVFEVENRLMIRPEQYNVAKHLIENPGHVIQLNMGLGKTRVILPMLVLYYSYRIGKEKYLRDKVTRLHFLSALFEEAFRYLQNHLTASILCVNIYAMPFCRDFQLDVASLDRMKNAMNDCQLDGGALVVAPEHRLSLELKAKELYRSGEKEIASQIEALINKNIWRDILDECDELLRHRYQLIYAIGTPVPLPGRIHRCRAIQALCHALTQDDELKLYLKSNEDSCQLATKSKEQWPEIQFFDGESLSTMLGDHSSSQPLSNGLLSRLVDVILCKPPHEFKWMLELDLTRKQIIKKVMVEKDYSNDELQHLHHDYVSDVLALRGLLTGGVLRHCLLKRHRVNYGVARPGKKRLAVPFRFADTPDERSEFAHPDCALFFTHLAYYRDGLTRNELMQALKTLMKLGDNAQRNFYNRWLAISSDQMEKEGPDEMKSLDCIEKIDLSNKVQMEKMYTVYHQNMETIDFYLNYCVFPTETDQFDSRLTATSWNLAQNPSEDIVGFSGTNDNWRILPLQVKQYFASHYEDSDPILKSLDGTNGRMLETIMKNTLSIQQLAQDSNRSQSLMGILNSPGCFNAIIDCGALLAGINLDTFSKEILSILPKEEFGGVLYYDNENHNDWIVLERSGRVLPKDISPITEKDTFAIFDEPRCRGTDLKLKKEAVALLTLAPNICKDKLMQSAGRLRKLGQGQKLVIVGGSDVFTQLNELRKDSSPSVSSSLFSWATASKFKPTTTDVLSWSMRNTVESTAAGLFNWANQAFFFTSTYGKDPLLCITDEVLELRDMYGKSFAHKTVVDSTSNALQYHLRRTGESNIGKNMKDMILQTQMRVNEYGGDFSFSVRGCDEECERELEMEVEEEEEVEVEVPLVDPMEEKEWNYKAVFGCSTPKHLPITVHLLSSFIDTFIRNKGSASIKWSENIYATSNFAKTIKCSPNSSLARYLRVVNFLLRFPDGSLLLLSEYEANHLLGLFWNSKSCSNSGGAYQILHICLLRQSLDVSREIFFPCSIPKRIRVSNTLFGTKMQAIDLVGEESMSSLQLFAGEPTYATEKRKCALKTLLRVCLSAKFCPLTEARRFVEMRGNEKLFPYSDLETICEQLLCEL